MKYKIREGEYGFLINKSNALTLASVLGSSASSSNGYTSSPSPSLAFLQDYPRFYPY